MLCIRCGWSNPGTLAYPAIGLSGDPGTLAYPAIGLCRGRQALLSLFHSGALGDPGQARLCGKCGAVLPRSVAEGEAAGLLGPEAVHEHDGPDVTYHNDALDALGEVISRFFEDEAGIEEVEERILVLEQRLSTLLETLHPVLEALRTQRDLLPDESQAQQVGFLVNTGVLKLNDAIDGLYQALETSDDEAIEPLLAELAAGNDYVCHAGLLLDRIVTELEERD